MSGSAVKIIAIGIVVVVAVAGVATFLVMNKDDKSNVNVDAALEVYGNADNDYKIDANDKDVIQKIINGEEGYTLEKYPLADAFYDGEVNEKDLTQVQKILDGEDCTVWHLWYKTNTSESRWDSKVVDTKWPIKKCIANGAANALLCYSMLGLDDKIAAINYSSTSPPDKVLYPKYNAMPSLGTSTTNLTASAVTKAVSEDRAITAVLTADNKSYLSSPAASGKVGEDELESQGIDVIRIKHAAVDPKEFSSALLLLGFLFQKENTAQEAATWIEDVYKELDEKLKGVTTKVKVAVASGDAQLSMRNSDYADVSVQAGGVYTYPVKSTSSMKMAENAWMYNDEYQMDKIVMIRTGGSNGTWYEPNGLDYTKFQSIMDGYALFNCYKEGKNVYLISGDMPVVARVLYTAAILYPDLVSEDYANEIHQKYVDRFLGSAYNVSELKFMYNYAEVSEKVSA